MAAVLKIDRDKAKELLVALGLKTAKKYTDAKLLGMLSKLDATDDTADPGKHTKLYDKIIKANQEEKDLALIGVESEVEEEEVPKPAKGRKAKAKAKVVEEEEEDDDEEEEEEPAPKKGKRGRKTAAVEDDEPAPKKSRSGGDGARSTDKEGRTAKDRVYLEWIEQGGKALEIEDTDYDAITKAAKAGDKAPGTIRGWISAWRSDKGLPRIAKRMEAEAPAPKKGKKGKKAKSDDE